MKSVTAGVLVTALAAVALGVAAVPPAAATRSQAITERSATTQVQARRVPSTYQVATYNVLGWSHTLGGARGFQGGVHRIFWAKRLLERHGVDVAGFQELQTPQLRRFLELADGGWAFYPGERLLQRDSENSIGWRTNRFELVDASTVRIPYFDGAPRTMPVVLLRDKTTGAMTYFSNFHNPADTGKHPNQGRWRLEASRVEIALQNQLWSRGIPRITTGDMNERKEYFCRVTRNGTPLTAARPGSARVNGVCHPGRPPFVDWIFGSNWLNFSGYTEDNGRLAKRVSDHPLIVSTVTVDPDRMPRAYAPAAPPHFVPQVSY